MTDLISPWREMDMARSVQVVTEDIVLRMARHARVVTDARALCLAGGVALNCVANGELLRSGIFDDIWIQPAAGDAGGSLGAALYVWHQYLGNARTPNPNDGMKGSYLGPQFSDSEVHTYLTANQYPFKTAESLPDWARTIAQYLADQKIVGLCHGRMEFGPRSLGHRSIVGDARSPKMQSVMNLKIKYRESFRPFAPAVLRERVGEYFDMDGDSPYMLLVAPVQKSRRIEVPRRDKEDLIDWIKPGVRMGPSLGKAATWSLRTGNR